MWVIPGIVCVNRQKMTLPVVFFNLATPVEGIERNDSADPNKQMLRIRATGFDNLADPRDNLPGHVGPL